MICNLRKTFICATTFSTLLICKQPIAQVCSGSLGTPIVNITFGSGSTNPGPQIPTQIPGATTNYRYANYATGSPPTAVIDGDYALLNSVPSNSAWYSGAGDHTGNPNGYMAFFNSAPTPGEFYRQTVSGLCPGTTYEFATWVANVLNPSVLPGAILPNITFKIINPSTLAVLGTYNTGNIPMANSMTWRQYSFLFITPAATNSVTLVLENNNVGGNAQPGNDLALDDITFKPCGPSVAASLNNPSICANQSANLMGSITGNLNNPAFQWQISSDGGNTFSNIQGATTANYSLSGLPAGSYKLHLLAAEAANIGSPSCRFISNIIDLTISAPPSAATFTVTQPSCGVTSASVSISSPVGANFQYSLNGGNYQSLATFNNLTQGNYTITVRNSSSGCVSQASSFSVNAPTNLPPTPIISPITQPDCVTSTGSFTVSSPIGPGLEYSINGINYQTSTAFSTVGSGSYNLTVRNISTGCVSQNTSVIINNAPAIPAIPVLAVTQPTCLLTTGSIVTTSPVGSQLEYSLNGGPYQSSPSFTALVASSYNVRVRNNTSSCISAPSFVVIDPVPQPPATPVVGNLIHPTCSLQSGSIQISSPSGNDLRYSIDGINFQTAPTFIGIAPGNYTAVVTNNVTGCVSSQTPFTVNSIPTLPSSPDVIVTQQPSCTISSGSLQLTSPIGSNYAYSITGSNYQSSPIFNNLDTGTYLVTVRDKLTGCESAPTPIAINADVSVGGRYYLPNVFTPNRDGINDCFGVTNWGAISEFRLMVYNRWGEEVFYTTNPDQCWDGMYKGVPAISGNYVYHVRAISLCGIVERKGNLALIR